MTDYRTISSALEDIGVLREFRKTVSWLRRPEHHQPDIILIVINKGVRTLRRKCRFRYLHYARSQQARTSNAMLHRPPVFFPQFQWFPWVSTAETALFEKRRIVVSLTLSTVPIHLHAIIVTSDRCAVAVAADARRLRWVLKARTGHGA